MRGPVVSLLPARNASADLPGHLDSVARFADAVVALDDGSTDDTRAILEAHPLVHAVLTSPRRTTYAGWDDADNRSRLLAEAQRLSPSWIMSLDADELVTADDGAALRAFLDDGADPEDAYLFQVLRMIGDLDHHDGSELWVGRLFAPEPGHAFPSDKLHFVPLPTAVPRDRWRKTTFRIQHRGSLTAEQRQARFDKYGEADPDRTWQGSYSHLLRAPVRRRNWYPRGRLLPPVAHEPVVDPLPLGVGEPAWTVVVLADGRLHAGTGGAGDAVLDSVAAQEIASPVEVVVVATGPQLAARIGRDHPAATVVEAGRSASPGLARNLGLAAARGRHLLFLDASTRLAPGHLTARLALHEQGWPLVADVVRHRGTTRSGWAHHVLHRSAALPARGSSALESAPERCSFRRDLLLDVGGFREDLPADVEAVMAGELFSRGYGAFRSAGVVVERQPPVTGPVSLVREEFRSGRTQGHLLMTARAEGALSTRGVSRRHVRALPGRIGRVRRDAQQGGGDLERNFRRAQPLVVVGAVAGWLGSTTEVVRQLAQGTMPGRRRRSRTR